MASPADEFHLFDTTLRDGAQREGISYSVTDKLAVARLLDELGVGFIEGGWPGAMPKDTEFFARARSELSLRHAELVAFGSTRKAGVAVEQDVGVDVLATAGLGGRDDQEARRFPAHHQRRAVDDLTVAGRQNSGRRDRRVLAVVVLVVTAVVARAGALALWQPRR